ncbi:MAG TPA: hypothetical protein VJ960_09510 [Oceanipulchritudo sp.]|nr:hypothetical protein [Oceanipulchritudo sp.]
MKKSATHILCLLFFLTAFIAGLGAQSLREQMTEEQFARAGLEKLSEEELAYLDDWMSGKLDEEKERVVNEIIPEGDDRFGAEETIKRNVDRIRPEPAALTARISGPFDGWDGDTVFRLDNGQVWKQVQRGKFSVRLDDPVVRIEKGFLGAYFLSVDGFGSRVKVKRLK